MNALDNANIEKPRSGLASFAFPEAKSSKTGVSVGYVPSPDRRWYVLRIKYGKAQAVADSLVEQGTYVYLAMVWRDVRNKVTGKNNMRGSKTQVIMSFAALFVPMFIMYGLVVAFGDNKTGAPLVMLVIGLIGTILHPWWLRNIYQRFIARRYQNMEGFRSTRKQ